MQKTAMSVMLLLLRLQRKALLLLPLIKRLPSRNVLPEKATALMKSQKVKQTRAQLLQPHLLLWLLPLQQHLLLTNLHVYFLYGLV